MLFFLSITITGLAKKIFWVFCTVLQKNPKELSWPTQYNTTKRNKLISDSSSCSKNVTQYYHKPYFIKGEKKSYCKLY